MFFRKKHLLLAGAFVACSNCFSQDSKVDSLLGVMGKQKEDTNKVNTLNALSRRHYLLGHDSASMAYANSAINLATQLKFYKGSSLGHTNLGFNQTALENYDKALEHFKQSMALAERSGDKRFTAIASNNIGWGYGNMGNNSKALEYYTLAAKISEEAGDKKSAANAYYNIGNVNYSPISNFTEAIRAHSISLKLSKEINDKPRVAYRYIDIGNSYESLGNYPEAIKNYLSALKISEEIGARGNMGVAYNNIGEIYGNQGNYMEALKNYEAGLKLFKEVKNDEGIAISYQNIGEVFQKQGKYSEAMNNLNEALKIHKEIEYNYGAAYTYRSIGYTYYTRNDYENALRNYMQALEIFKKMEENEGLAKVYQNIGETYLKMNRLTESRTYLNNALSTAKQFMGKKIIMETYEELAKLDSAEANWQQAYRDHKMSVSYKDSLLNEENTKKITESRMQYEFDKKEETFKYQQALTSERLKQQQMLAKQHQQELLLKDQELEINEQDLALVKNQKHLQGLQIQKDSVLNVAQRIEISRKQDELALLNKEKDLQALRLKRQTLFRNYLLGGLASLFIISILIYRHYRTRQELKLQLLRNKIASDLHDDVGSTLSSISIFSQMAQQQSKEVMPLLETIGESSRKMLDAMADIVWTIKPENDQFEKIILRMKNFAYDLLGAKNIDFEFVAENEVSKMNLPMDVRKNLYLIFKEATNNLVKYSSANKASFLISGENKLLRMVIRDNGKGFDLKDSKPGNGLINMKKRAEEIGALFSIDSAPGNGTTIELKIAV